MHHSDFITELAGIVTATPRREDAYAAAPAQAQQDAPAAVAVHEGFFSYCDDDGFTKHDTIEAAKVASQDMIDMLREEAGTDEWPGSTGSVCYGVIVGQSTEVPGEQGPGGEETADYVLLAAAPAAPAAQTFQHRVQPWMMACFGPEIAADRLERNHRFLEESVELVQANGCTQSEAHQLVDYVYGRPVGEPAQEVGGVMVTLAALCLASGLDMHAAGETELARIWTKVEAIRAKQAAKPKHSPLPAAPASQDAQDAALTKPEPGRYVLAWMEGRTTPIRAMWVPSKWLKADNECPEDWAEYDEAADEYFCPEGWYEKNEHEEKNWSVSTPVVAWMELPRLDAALAAQQAGGSNAG